MHSTRHFLLWVGLLLLLHQAPAQPPKPGLFVLTVGVSKYKNPKYNLKYAHKDALDLAEAWRKQTDLYDVREVKTLVNEQATRANIRAAFTDLKKKVSPTSLLVFVFSGHGLNDALVTHEFDNDDRTATTLGRSDLTTQLGALGGNYIALIDACHSGSFAKNFSGGKDISTESRSEQDAAISNMLRALSAPDKANIVIGSSSSSEKSDECDACQNGYFTQCLLDAFEGKVVVDGRRTIRPDVDGNGFVETNELDAYIKDAVFYATRTNQFPQNVLAQQTIGYNFSIVRPANSAGAGKPIAYDNSRTGSSVATPPDLSRPAAAKSVAFQTTLTDAKDQDGDGLPDLFDLCPSQQGELRFWGCSTDPDPNSQWSQQSDGAIPAGAVSLGMSPAGKARFLVRVGGTRIGYIDQGSKTAQIISQRQVIDVNVYDVLHKGQFNWQYKVKGLSGKVVLSAVQQPQRRFYCIVRTQYNGVSYVGTLSSFSDSANFFTGENKLYRTHQFDQLIDVNAPVAKLTVKRHENLRHSFLLYVNGDPVSRAFLSSFDLPEVRAGKTTLRAMVQYTHQEVFQKARQVRVEVAPLEITLVAGQSHSYVLGKLPTGNYAIVEESQQSVFEGDNRPSEPIVSTLPVPDARVVRWVSPITGDFETLREDFNPDAQLQGWGYKDKRYQFSAYKTRPNDPNATAVNRWVMPNCAASILIAEHEIPDATLLSWGYKNKQFLFYAYRYKPATGDFVAVNRWINAKLPGDPCRDFTLTVAETELTDAQLQSNGYREKKTQFYIPRPRP